MKFFILFAVLIVAAVADHSDEDKEAWKQFKLSFGKMFLSKNTEKERMNNFLDNKKTIDQINDDFHEGKSTFTAKVYSFHDLSVEQFRSRFTGYKASNDTPDIPKAKLPFIRQLPRNLDLRTTGQITPIKNQGQCGSCWTFSATAPVESCYYRRNRQIIDLSEQQLVDCVYSAQGHSGCQGGAMHDAYNWMQSNGGQTSENNIIYTGTYTGNCKKPSPLTNIASYTGIGSSNDEVKQALNTYGPLTIVVNADEYMYYNGGIFQASSQQPANHAVNMIGYGTDNNGINYWIVRNSWGTSFGENGYIRIAMDSQTNSWDPSYVLAVTC